MRTSLVSIILPSRNERYLKKTIDDILTKATGDIEVIAVLDGYWPDEIVEDDRVNYIHFTNPLGMRNAINSGVKIAQGEFIMKSDAHCMFNYGFDEVLKKDLKDNWVVVPRRYRLDPVKWEIIRDGRPPIDYMYLDNELHGRIWEGKSNNHQIDYLMSSQGSFWMMKRSYFDYLELMDEKNYGTFYGEFQEIGLKCWLSGGEVMLNKNTWYAHWHKSKEDGRGYHLSGKEGKKAEEYVQKWKTEKMFSKQIYDFQWLINKFKPVPTWE